MTAFLTPGPVQVGAIAVFLLGLGLLLVRREPEGGVDVLVGPAAFLTTLATLATYATSVRPSDGRAGWRSIWNLFDRSFYDSWPYVFVVGVIAAALWVLVDRWRQRRWQSTRVVGITVGSIAAAVIVKLLAG